MAFSMSQPITSTIAAEIRTAMQNATQRVGHGGSGTRNIFNEDALKAYDAFVTKFFSSSQQRTVQQFVDEATSGKEGDIDWPGMPLIGESAFDAQFKRLVQGLATSPMNETGASGDELTMAQAEEFIATHGPEDWYRNAVTAGAKDMADKVRAFVAANPERWPTSSAAPATPAAPATEEKPATVETNPEQAIESVSDPNERLAALAKQLWGAMPYLAKRNGWQGWFERGIANNPKVLAERLYGMYQKALGNKMTSATKAYIEGILGGGTGDEGRPTGVQADGQNQNQSNGQVAGMDFSGGIDPNKPVQPVQADALRQLIRSSVGQDITNGRNGKKIPFTQEDAAAVYRAIDSTPNGSVEQILTKINFKGTDFFGGGKETAKEMFVRDLLTGTRTADTTAILDNNADILNKADMATQKRNEQNDANVQEIDQSARAAAKKLDHDEQIFIGELGAYDDALQTRINNAAQRVRDLIDAQEKAASDVNAGRIEGIEAGALEEATAALNEEVENAKARIEADNTINQAKRATLIQQADAVAADIRALSDKQVALQEQQTAATQNETTATRDKTSAMDEQFEAQRGVQARLDAQKLAQIRKAGGQQAKEQARMNDELLNRQGAVAAEELEAAKQKTEQEIARIRASASQADASSRAELEQAQAFFEKQQEGLAALAAQRTEAQGQNDTAAVNRANAEQSVMNIQNEAETATIAAGPAMIREAQQLFNLHGNTGGRNKPEYKELFDALNEAQQNGGNGTARLREAIRKAKAVTVESKSKGGYAEGNKKQSLKEGLAFAGRFS